MTKGGFSMKNRAVLKFFLIYFGFTITSNFVHPITPAFLQMIEAPISRALPSR